MCVCVYIIMSVCMGKGKRGCRKGMSHPVCMCVCVCLYYYVCVYGEGEEGL